MIALTFPDALGYLEPWQAILGTIFVVVGGFLLRRGRTSPTSKLTPEQADMVRRVLGDFLAAQTDEEQRRALMRVLEIPAGDSKLADALGTLGTIRAMAEAAGFDPEHDAIREKVNAFLGAASAMQVLDTARMQAIIHSKHGSP